VECGSHAPIISAAAVHWNSANSEQDGTNGRVGRLRPPAPRWGLPRTRPPGNWSDRSSTAILTAGALRGLSPTPSRSSTDGRHLGGVGLVMVRGDGVADADPADDAADQAGDGADVHAVPEARIDH